MQEKIPGLVATTGIWKGLHPAMGIASKGMIAAFVVFTVLNVEFANSIYSAVRAWIESALNWYYISALTVMLFVCLYLMCSRHGSIKLGDDDSKPEFSNFSWFAMLFSAGVGIGLLFFGIAEPIFYFDNTQPWGYPNNPFADSGPGHRDERDARGVRDARDLLPLGIPRLGGLRDDWPLPRLLRVPQEASAYPSLRPLSRHRGPDLRPHRSRGRPAGRLRDGVRGRHFPRSRGQPDGDRSQLPVWNRPGDDDAGHSHRGHLHRGHVFRGVRGGQRHPDHLGVEHLAERRAARLLPLRRPLSVADGILRDDGRRLPVERHPDGLPDLQRAGRFGLAGRLDHLLLGLVDLLGAVRRHVHRADQPRAHHPRVHARGDVRSHHHRLLLAQRSSAATRCTSS